jgi:hypothetical protein
MQDFNSALYSPLVSTMETIFIVAFIFSCILVLYLYKNKSNYLITALPLFVLASHQLEEYVLSPLMFGDKYHFLEWAFRSGVNISPIEVTTINSVPYFLLPLLFLLKPSTKIFSILFLFNSSLLLSNGMFHIGLATAQTNYSPGMVTSLFMYIPLYIKSLYLASERSLPMRGQIAITIYGSIAHFLMIWLVNIF